MTLPDIACVVTWRKVSFHQDHLAQTVTEHSLRALVALRVQTHPCALDTSTVVQFVSTIHGHQNKLVVPHCLSHGGPQVRICPTGAQNIVAKVAPGHSRDICKSADVAVRAPRAAGIGTVTTCLTRQAQNLNGIVLNPASLARQTTFLRRGSATCFARVAGRGSVEAGVLSAAAGGAEIGSAVATDGLERPRKARSAHDVALRGPVVTKNATVVGLCFSRKTTAWSTRLVHVVTSRTGRNAPRVPVMQQAITVLVIWVRI